ncbi:class II aldolase/adducin family protein [Actinomadura alba]|uniref:class II aldolase/adducin family protein n=1 Tax=Actinomadura alba TaxID=406431 RepID=UPI0028A62851|nr:class II aldolase/adducin family protein [Actinomadura alba]
MTVPTEFTDLRRTIALACRILANAGLAEDILGHVSVRVGADRMLVRCRGPQEQGLLFTFDEDVRQVDLDGRGELEGWAVPNELPIHGEVLRARPEVDAVVHCHPPAVLVAGVEEVPLRPVFGAYNIPAARMALEGVPVYPRAVLVRRPELGRELVEAMGASTVCVMRGHGITTVGSGPHAVEQAVVRALTLDVLARVSVERARLGDRAADLTPEDVAELPDLGSSFNDLNIWRHHVARLRLSGLALD